MFYFTPAQLPVSNFLGGTFAVSDHYFASGPVQTLPNRMVSICGTSGTDFEGHACINDTQFALGDVKETSILDLLDDAGGADQPFSIIESPICSRIRTSFGRRC